eukprot:360213-Chlamydomonas_euryale.AAC.2
MEGKLARYTLTPTTAVAERRVCASYRHASTDLPAARPVCEQRQLGTCSSEGPAACGRPTHYLMHCDVQPR